MTKSTTSSTKRILVIKAAAKVFSRQGFHQARVEDIALAAGVGKGTIYEYFDSKHRLFEEVVQESLKFYSGQTDAVNLKKFSLHDQIHHLFYMHLKFSIDYHDISKVALGDYTLGSEEIHQWMREMRREKVIRVKEMLERAKETGEVDQSLDSDLAATLLWGMLGVLCSQVMWSDETHDIDQIAEKVAHITMRGLGLVPGT